MSTSNERIYYLLRAYTGGTVTLEEEQELYEWLQEAEDTAILKDYIRHIVRDDPSNAHFENVNWEGIYDRIVEQKSNHSANIRQPPIRRIVWYRRVVAVLLILILDGGIYFFLRNQYTPDPSLAKVSQHHEGDIMPRQQKAILKAGSVKIEINQNDTTFQLGGNTVHLTGGQIETAMLKAAHYTLITPKGGTYQVKLADGTLVWLNAASTLKYPSVFAGSNREVTVEGEAFFDVQEDPNHPFIVHAAGQTIQVLGTAFNIQVYKDEPRAVTTLVTGKLQVSIPGDTSLLAPGQQTQWNKYGRLQLNKHAEIAQAVAWKNGYFRFYNEDIRTIMRRLARWYDVEVTYDAGLKPHYFGGLISRDNNLSKVLKMLEATSDVHFKVEKNKVTVMP